MKDKIALFCNVDPGAVFTALDVKSIYEVPLELHREGLDDKLAELLNIWSRAPRLEKWEQIVEKVTSAAARAWSASAWSASTSSCRRATRASTRRWSTAASPATSRSINEFVDSTRLEEGDLAALDDVDGILVPGGFGIRGIEGKILAVRYAREQQDPLLRHLPGHADGGHRVRPRRARPAARQLARVRRADPGPGGHPDGRPEGRHRQGRHHAAGRYPCQLKEGTLARELYGKEMVSERHRHRYEFNNAYRARYEAAGMVFSGVNPDLGLVEMIELTNHPYFVGCQFHPEFKSKPFAPHPLFAGFVKAARDHRDAAQRAPQAEVTKLPLGKNG